jgi:hypothetical protein
MNDIDTLLHDAGALWRASQPNPSAIDPVALIASRRQSSPASLLLAGAAGAALVLVIGAVSMQMGLRPGGGPGPVGPSPQPSVQPSPQPVQSVEPSQIAASPTAGRSATTCEVTRPIPPFTPPAAFLATPPAVYASDWFGSAALWTMIAHQGETWKQSELPHNPDGLTQKTFWWSADWPARAEPEPAITVVGTRLDAPGSFTFGPGTNASADFGTAMLVGVDFPTPGCWQLTARYREAVLSYVVWITED